MRNGPYSYSVARAKSLLSPHGWSVKPNGVSTCAKPGTGAGQCGAGIAKGAPLSFNIAYAAGVTSVDQEMQAWKSALSLVGIRLNLAQQPASNIFSTMTPCSPHSAACKWQMSYWGTGWSSRPTTTPAVRSRSRPAPSATGAATATRRWTPRSRRPRRRTGCRSSTTGPTTPPSSCRCCSCRWRRFRSPRSAATCHGALPQPSAGLAITPENWYLHGPHVTGYLIRRLWHALLVVIGVDHRGVHHAAPAAGRPGAGDTRDPGHPGRDRGVQPRERVDRPAVRPVRHLGRAPGRRAARLLLQAQPARLGPDR